jgi:TRAP-type C4-dicarboxylate transport system substrate-binding protein
MKRRTGSLIGAIVLASAAVGSTAMAKDYIFATFVPPRHGIVIESIEPMIEEIKKATNGEISFQLKAGAQLFGPEVSVTSTGEGIADVTTGTPSYTPALLPRQNILADMQMFLKDPRAGAAAVLEQMVVECPECQEDFKKVNTMVLASYGTGPAVLFCNKDVKSLADVKGLKIRTTGGQGRLAQLMGAVAVRMGTNEMAGAMEKGQINCISGAPSWIKSYGLFDYVKSIYDYPIGTYSAASLFIVNVKTWKSWKPEHRKALMPILARGMARSIVDGYNKFDDETIEEVKKRGIPINKAEPAMDEVMKKLLANEVNVIEQNAKRFGVDNTRQIADRLVASNARWEKIIAGIPRTDTDGYAKALWENLFSKLDPERL